MKNAFEALKRISNDYRATVDGLGEDYELAGRQDYLYNDTLKGQRVQQRNADFNERIAQAAARAQTAAGLEIGKLRAALQTYITNSTDPATVQTLQALLAAGVELSDIEIAAFAEKGGYAILKLLEKPSRGHIVAPAPERYKLEMDNLERHFKDLWAYRGSMADFGPGGYAGRSSAVGSVIMQGKLDKFPAEVDAMAQRWAALEP